MQCFSECFLLHREFVDRQGEISYDQFVLLLKSIGIIVSKRDLQAIQAEYEHRGRFSYDDLLAVGSVMYNNDVLKHDLMQAFAVMDPQKTGNIPLTEFKHVMKSLGLAIKLSPGELTTLLHDADPNKTGVCKYEDFIDRIINR